MFNVVLALSPAVCLRYLPVPAARRYLVGTFLGASGIMSYLICKVPDAPEGTITLLSMLGSCILLLLDPYVTLTFLCGHPVPNRPVSA